MCSADELVPGLSDLWLPVPRGSNHELCTYKHPPPPVTCELAQKIQGSLFYRGQGRPRCAALGFSKRPKGLTQFLRDAYAVPMQSRSTK